MTGLIDSEQDKDVKALCQELLASGDFNAGTIRRSQVIVERVLAEMKNGKQTETEMKNIKSLLGNKSIDELSDQEIVASLIMLSNGVYIWSCV